MFKQATAANCCRVKIKIKAQGNFQGGNFGAQFQGQIKAYLVERLVLGYFFAKVEVCMYV